MSGFPIANLTDLINAINQFKISSNNIATQIQYKYTLTTDKIEILPNIPTKIIDTPDNNNYEIFISSRPSNNCDIFFYIGDDGDTKLTVENSALFIKPGTGITNKYNNKIIIWAISKEKSDIIITINSKFPNLTKMTISLNIALIIGTGENFGKEFYISSLLNINDDWRDRVSYTVDTDQGITGYKLAYLSSYQPGDTYEFNVMVNPNFTDFNPDKNKPIHIHLIDINLIHIAYSTIIASMGENHNLPTLDTIQRIIGDVKKGGLVTNLPATGGLFKITPTNNQSILHFGACTSDGIDACVITDYNKTTNTFTLGGY